MPILKRRILLIKYNRFFLKLKKGDLHLSPIDLPNIKVLAEISVIFRIHGKLCITNEQTDEQSKSKKQYAPSHFHHENMPI